MKLLHMYSELRIRPYKFALKYYDLQTHVWVVELRHYRSYGDFACGVLQTLSDRDPEFMARVCATDEANRKASARRTRRYVAERKEDLYIDSPHLTDRYSKAVGRYWVATNIGGNEASEITVIAAGASVRHSSWSKLKL